MKANTSFVFVKSHHTYFSSICEQIEVEHTLNINSILHLTTIFFF